ncbi:hypothetical protein T4B_4466 [Trichinella pseudospiralis]|uniref:Uncharacterized protein n=1 Tax=Trichinella pseudospiralis TaxID=6337 RepID=A0A0V1DQB5_TRIPS|nr:hypothetical protein T4A_11059 [Trichinella pseudospiralis]KRZ00053.1 hypothetical protein T4B_4466 [Trichinella pseudospiralis]
MAKSAKNFSGKTAKQTEKVIELQQTWSNVAIQRIRQDIAENVESLYDFSGKYRSGKLAYANNICPFVSFL